MMKNFSIFRSHLDLAHLFWEKWVAPGYTVVDATCGNGQDTYFLATLLQGVGRLFAYDIQQSALESTQRRLQHLSDKERSIITLELKSHATFDLDYAHLIVYNLGYLPGGDHSLTTLTTTTLESVQQALTLIVPGGAISITCYPGHAEGAAEKKALFSFLSTLDSDEWNISHHHPLKRHFERNQDLPSLIFLQRCKPPP